jgi:hypothetical protein
MCVEVDKSTMKMQTRTKKKDEARWMGGGGF